MSDCSKNSSPLFNMGVFKSETIVPKKTAASDTVDTYSDVSKDMDIFQRIESQFLPPGKEIEDLTNEELAQLKRQYRFDYYKPGVYQGITGLGNMM